MLADDDYKLVVVFGKSAGYYLVLVGSHLVGDKLLENVSARRHIVAAHKRRSHAHHILHA